MTPSSLSQRETQSEGFAKTGCRGWFASRLKTVSLSIAVLFIVSIGVYIALFGLDIPFFDQWEMVPLLVKFEQGTLSWQDLLAQHNEHRPLFPRLLWLILARLTDYNTNAELWLNFGIALATYAVFMLYIFQVWKHYSVELTTKSTYIPILTLLTFNLVQWESWLTGFQTVMFLGMFCIVAGFTILAHSIRWSSLVIGILLGVIATFSVGNALLYWPIGLLLVLVYSRNWRIYRVVAWCAVSLLVAIVYLHNWTTGSIDLAGIAALNPISYLHWLLNFLGSPLLAYPPAFLGGILGLALLVLLAYKAKGLQSFRYIAPYWAIILFTVGSAVVIGVGRSQGGPQLALAPRYITQTSWYWASILALLSVAWISLRFKRVVLMLVTSLLVLSTLGGAISGYKWRYLRTLPAYEAIRSEQYVSDDSLRAIYGIEPAVARQRLATLCLYKWSACR